VTYLIRITTDKGIVTHLMVGVSEEAMREELADLIEGIARWGTVESFSIQEFPYGKSERPGP
jgi:hypothetical protein